jgi:ADP-glucose pyrophosphorylase
LAHLVPQALPLIHPNARVAGGGRVIGLSVLGPGAVVEPGALVSDSLLLPGARVLSGARVQGAILGDGFIAQGELKGGAYA